MEWFAIFLQALHQVGITLGVGGSTFALIFFIQGLRDGVIDPSEKRFMRTVFTVIRIGMASIILSLVGIGGLLLWYTNGAISALGPLYAMEWTVMGVIIVNAILMTRHVMPMWLGPVLAGGSWYSLFLLTVLPLAGVSYITMAAGYVAFVLIFFAVFTAIKKRFTPPKPSAE